ncbi:MAG: ATP-binding protein [Treponemataceae bacterium]|nr:ATP-binding protein [Treponemataceae bacterium]
MSFLVLVTVNTFSGYGEEKNFFIDLNKYPLYVRQGFDSVYCKIPPDLSDPLWEVWKAQPDRVVRFIDMPAVHTHRFLELKQYPVVEYTYAIPFKVPEEQFSSLVERASIVPALYLEGIGDNWEIYVNGILLRREIYLDDKGKIASHRSYRQVTFPFDKQVLTKGANLLTIRIIGEDSHTATGFWLAKPFFIGDYETVQKTKDETWTLVLCGIYCFIGLYFLFLFLIRRQDKYNFYYGLLSTILSLYYFTRTHTIYSFIPNTDITFRMEFSFLYLVIPVVSAFIDNLHENKTEIVTRIYAIFCGLLVVLTAWVPMPFAHDLLRIWQISALGMILYIFFYGSSFRFLGMVYRRWHRLKQYGNPPSYWRVLADQLIHSPQGNVFLGALLLFCTALYDVIDSIFILSNRLYSPYGLFFFTIGCAGVLANRYNFVFKQLSIANQKLEETIEQLTISKEQVELHAQKYRSLFEGTTDAVALLDMNLTLQEYNPAAQRLFNLTTLEKSGPIHLIDILYKDERTENIIQGQLYEIRERLKSSSEPVELLVQLVSPVGEPISCTFRFERIRYANAYEIILRAVPESRNSLVSAFLEGREHYSIENTLLAADEICRHVCSKLGRYLSQEEVTLAMMGLREMVINAIEHGNLEVSYEEKTQAQKEQRYFEFLAERKEHPRYKNRRVRLEYSITAERAVYRITDEGKGFDHTRYLKGNSPETVFKGDHPLEHGRGIMMSTLAFDRIIYNEKGNQVTLEKRFSKNVASNKMMQLT